MSVTIQTLPEDLCIDLILPCLHIDDVVQLPFVCKSFQNMSVPVCFRRKKERAYEFSGLAQNSLRVCTVWRGQHESFMSKISIGDTVLTCYSGGESCAKVCRRLVRSVFPQAGPGTYRYRFTPFS